MQHLEVSGAVRHIYIYIIRRLKVNVAQFLDVIIFRITNPRPVHRITNLRYDMVFIYCQWVSTRWQRWVDLYKNRKETAIYRRRNNTQNNKKTE